MREEAVYPTVSRHFSRIHCPPLIQQAWAANVNTIEEIQEAIGQLTSRGREIIADWLRDLIVEEDQRVAEPAAAYGARIEHRLMSIEEYLEFEEGTPIRHEYVAGEIFAMSGGSLEHELIGGNVFAAFHAHLRGGPCKSFMNNFKLHLEVNESKFFYYPDVMVACGPSADIRFCTNPRLVVEVLSPSTERTDRREKAANYRQIPSLEEYVLVAQRSPEITIYRRSEHWAPLILSSLEETAEFRSIELSLPLGQIYEGACTEVKNHTVLKEQPIS
jgi:Uma2 family endonuclease